jgi:hypothetical protein
MELKIEMRKVADLLPYARNARTHSEEQIKQIAASIKEFGFNNPVAIDKDNMILCGHGRVLGAQKLGMEEVPCVCLSHLSETQKKAYILADNKIALNSDWDNDLLKLEFEDLKLDDFDLILTGFDEKEINELLESELDDIDDTYSNKVESPQYEIKGENPKLSDCFDDTKTNELLADIESAKIPENIKQFLRLASYRHTVFNYTNIAEYYAHASKEVQKLFEDSALVIIDFDDAIKKGYVKLKADLKEQLEREKEEE